MIGFSVERFRANDTNARICDVSLAFPIDFRVPRCSTKVTRWGTFCEVKKQEHIFKATGRYRQQNYSGMKFYLSIQNFGIWEFNVSFTFAFVLNCKMWNCVRCMRIWKPWFKLQINISIKTNYVLIQLLSNVEKKMFHV